VTQLRVALMTAPSADVAESIVAALLSERLIACGNITLPVVSIYRWQGETERAAEVLVIMKTTAPAVPALLKRIPELHPYDVPEILLLPVPEGYAPYLKWVQESVVIRPNSHE
jgi:periplasmic divalent cation tolerance protein